MPYYRLYYQTKASGYKTVEAPSEEEARRMYDGGNLFFPIEIDYDSVEVYRVEPVEPCGADDFTPLARLYP